MLRGHHGNCSEASGRTGEFASGRAGKHSTMSLGLETCRILLSVQYTQLWVIRIPVILCWDVVIYPASGEGGLSMEERPGLGIRSVDLSLGSITADETLGKFSHLGCVGLIYGTQFPHL